jgi:hypothetical protein
MEHIMPGIDLSRSHPALTDAQAGLANRLRFDLVYNYLFLARKPWVFVHGPAGVGRIRGTCVDA